MAMLFQLEQASKTDDDDFWNFIPKERHASISKTKSYYVHLQNMVNCSKYL